MQRRYSEFSRSHRSSKVPRVRGFPRRFRFPWRSMWSIHREVDEELQFHLDMRIQELQATGLAPPAAEREARQQFGDLTATQKSLKSAARRYERNRRSQLMFDELFRDLRYAWRGLARSRSFTLIAVLVLALAIGVNSAIFSVLNVVMMRPVKMESPGEMCSVYSQDTERPEKYRAFSYPTYRDFA